MIRTDEDDEFDRVRRENALREVQRLGQEIEGQPYHFQKREWVGLTDQDIRQMGLGNYLQVVRETEAKLKEKNEKT
jgi:hypothetical protein